MSVLYIDATMGLSSTKLLGALIGCMEKPGQFIGKFNDIGFDGIRLEEIDSAERGIRGRVLEFRRTDVENYSDEIDDDGETSHSRRHRESRHMMRGISEVREVIEDLAVSGRVRKRAAAVYDRIAETAAAINGMGVNEVVLHRTGSRDIIASVVGVFMALEELGCDRIYSSKIAVGSGKTMTSRGETDIPIPLVAELLSGAPTAAGCESFEMCTADGAAVISEITDSFGDKPYISEIRSGAGFGERVYKYGINCVRAVLGDVIAASADSGEHNAGETELEAIIYDNNADLEPLLTGLAAEGVKDAYTMPVVSAIYGSGVMVKVICERDLAEKTARYILKNSSAERVRRYAVITAAE